MNMKCPVCGAAELIHDTRDLPYTYKGETTLIAAVTGDFCPACAESVLDAAESDRVMREMRAFSKQINAAIVDPAFIASVRKKLALDQREAAEIFGGGANAFSRYENGKTRPPLALVKLLKMLDRHPDLLDEVRAMIDAPLAPDHESCSSRMVQSYECRLRSHRRWMHEFGRSSLRCAEGLGRQIESCLAILSMLSMTLHQHASLPLPPTRTDLRAGIAYLRRSARFFA
jgi:HTH-type transcriptional regulator / antitoxin MqsA